MTNYPNSLDTNDNLYLVHDGLRVVLSEDYSPGDTSITVESSDLIDKFPSNGIITLTEQLSDIDERALTFYYSSKTSTAFDGLVLLDGFTDVDKPKRITNVTQNVMAQHHNSIKDAIIAIEEFVGVKGTIDTKPQGSTMEGRINFLRKLVLKPRAWFSADKTIGLVPLTVTFTDKSFRLGENTVTFVWNFGDQTDLSYVSTVSVTSVVPEDDVNVIVEDLDGGTIEKTYNSPGIYDVTLTVTNEYGSDTVEFNNLINARIEAPEEAVMQFNPTGLQNTSPGDGTPLFDRLATKPGGPYLVPPTIRSIIGKNIEIEVPSGNFSSEITNAGEWLNDDLDIIDAIKTYTWELGDDLSHPNSNITTAMYSIGGVYDLKLRVDTNFGAYRITTYENCIDVIESKNLWLYTIDDSNLAKAHEFGLISETFKTATQTQLISKDDSFLDGIGGEERAKREFNRNNGMAATSSDTSGNDGDCLVVWSSGGSPLSSQTVDNFIYNGFSDTYTTGAISITRPWNWAFLASSDHIYFAFGPDPAETPNTNTTNQSKDSLNLSTLAVSNATLNISNYLNGAEELINHPENGSYTAGEPDSGRFAVYRSAWKDSTGYILRNDNVDPLFKFKDFYKTEGTLGNQFINIKKLSSMTGSVKTEGRLVTLSSGVFFFNNSGSVAAYNTTTNTWETGGPSNNSVSFSSLQDSSISGYSSTENTLLAIGDEDHNAYLSYDYSTNAYTKFNSLDLTFSSLGTRPTGDQWLMGIY